MLETGIHRALLYLALASSGRNAGFLGSIVIPGFAYSIVLWLLVINAKRIFSQALQMKMLTLLALFTICSALWSQDPFRSTYNGVYLSYRDIICILFGRKIRSRRDPVHHHDDGRFNLLSSASSWCFYSRNYGLTESARDGLHGWRVY